MLGEGILEDTLGRGTRGMSFGRRYGFAGKAARVLGRRWLAIGFAVLGKAVEEVQHPPFLIQDCLGLETREEVVQAGALVLVISWARDCNHD